MGNLLAAILFVSAQVLTIAGLLWYRSKRKDTEAKLIRSYERLRLAMKIGKSVGWDWDIASGRDFLFGDIQLFFGIPSDTHITTVDQFFSYVHPDDRARVGQAVADARQERKPYSSEFRISSNDGTTRWVAARGEFQYAADGTATRMLGLAVDITEKKRIEDALKKSEEKYSKAFRGSPLAVVITTVKEGRFIEVNDTFARATGWKRDELIGTTAAGLGMWVDPRQREDIVRVLAAGGSLRNVEANFRTRTGTLRTMLMSVELIETNGELCMIAAAADITERKLAEAALRESEERFRLAMNNVAAGLFTIDLQGSVNYVNPAAEAMFGWTSAELLGKNMHLVTHYMHPDGTPFPESDCACLRVLQNGNELREHEDVFVRKDGSFLPVVYSASPIRRDGKTVGLVVGFRDDTYRREADRAVRESEQRFRLVAHSAPVVIWMSDENKRCIYVNQRWLEMTGRPLEAQLGNGWTENIHPEDVDRCIEICAKAADRCESFRMEYRLRRHDGEYLWILDSGVPRRHPDGTFAGHIGSAVDVTEIKAAEQVLSTMSQRLIEAHEQERAWIAAELHDDIGQRLVMLTMKLEFLKRAIPASQPSAIEAIQDVMQQAQSLAEDIQYLSRNLHPSQPKYLGIAKAAASFCAELSARGLEVDFRSEKIPSDVPQEISLCLYRVLQESLQNAVKHSGCRHFEVSLIGEMNEIHLSVRDSGVGFDPMQAMKKRGIGLNSMKERLKLVNGKFLIDAKPNQGTTIHARVPLNLRLKAQGLGVG